MMFLIFLIDTCLLFIMGLLVSLASLGVRQRLYQKNSQRDTIKVFKPIVKRKEENMAQKAHSLSHTKWHCSITLCSPLSIDEKSSIINIEVV